MSKEFSIVLKGVAILMMLFLHLFNREENLSLITDILYINDKPIVYYIQYATHPVAFFLILSGYGLCSIYDKEFKDLNRYKRNIKLYTHYVVITGIFILFSTVILDKRYFDCELLIFYNISGLFTTWNHEAWFLLPFICISILYPLIIKMYDYFRFPIWLVIAVGYCVYIVFSWLLGHYNIFLKEHRFLFLFLAICHFLPMFVYGIILKRSNIIERFQLILNTNVKAFVTLFGLIILRCIFYDIWWGPLYALLFISIFASLNLHIIIKKGLLFLGKHSMNIWLIHTWLFYYLFHDEFYALKYPLLIFTAVLIVSLSLSIIFDYVFSRCLSKVW